MATDGLGSMGPQIDAYKKSLLEATATGGSAGAQAFKDAQAALAAERQASVGRAASRAALIGGPEAQGFEAAPNQYYGRGIANLESAGASFNADTQRRLSANQNYLSQAAASIPAYRAESDRLVSLKKASAEAAEAKASAKAAKNISLDELLGLASQAKTGAQSAVSALPKLDPSKGGLNAQAAALLGAGGPTVSGETLGLTSRPLSDIASQIGSALGVDNITLAGLYAPGKQSSLLNATENLNPTAAKDEAAKAIATKYDTKGVTYDLAKSVIGNVDFKAAVDDLLKKAATGEFTREEVDAHLRKQFLVDRNWPSEYFVLAGEYLHLFPEAE